MRCLRIKQKAFDYHIVQSFATHPPPAFPEFGSYVSTEGIEPYILAFTSSNMKDASFEELMDRFAVFPKQSGQSSFSKENARVIDALIDDDNDEEGGHHGIKVPMFKLKVHAKRNPLNRPPL